DMTRALRSPGSTLKPFVYALGFDDGLIHPETMIEDRPAVFGRWQPQNFDRRFRGTVTIRRALQESLNIPVVRVAEALGTPRIMATLRRAGMRVEVQGGTPGLALVLGGAGVSLHDLVAGYGALARGGQVLALTVLPGKHEPSGGGTRLVGPAAAWQIGAILAHVPPPEGRPAGRIAYKTGTSYGHRDALAIGYDGRFVGGIWLGRPDGTPVPGAFGGDLAAPVLFDMFDMLGTRRAPLPPPPPETLITANPGLPAPLRRFLPAGAIAPAAARPGQPFTAPGDPLTILFPPDGAELELTSDSIPVRLRGGVPPYTWLLNGAPAVIATPGPETRITASPGISELSVTDSTGTTRRARLRMNRP
ncbi:MAG: penicillin-binding transpeptidase domain-containing protein, partial [Paracoccus sp. (in: a-proteobacteria)]|nr:penicillin-binding transpeptidase domain-containing protein [Paracoccus sp. (in: a-proteobacteria)]